ncbi:hypothetical protein [Bacillus sp. m3-13]|uniref:hypothetical protein n=1 Tax=Bacillus sp. m3-13 TaxID=406124 RepID=UPI0002E5D7D3|nr:hypothetical protein [Bacillus sp. m3-13]
MKKLFTIFLLVTVVFGLSFSPAAAESSTVKTKSKNEMLELLGFTKEDVKSLLSNKGEVKLKGENKEKLNLNKKDILHLANLGFTKERIERFTQRDWDHFKDKEPADLVDVKVSYSKYNELTGKMEPATKEEYETAEKNNKEKYKKAKKNKSPGGEFSAQLCDIDTTCEGSNSSSMVRLVVAATHSTTYAIVSDFDWVYDSNERHIDLFGSGHKEALTVDYSTIFGSWTTEYHDNYGYVASRTTSTGSYYPDSNGYYHKLDRDSYSHEEYWQRDGQWLQAVDDSGYTYAEFDWSYGTSSSAYALYTHMKTGWSTSFGVSLPAGASISVSNTTSDVPISSAAVSFTK